MRIEEMQAAAEKFQTPFYVFDIDEARKRIAGIRESLKDYASICYAIKANAFLVKKLQGYVDKFEICSPGEYHIYEEQDMPGSTMLYSGVYKDEETFYLALERYHEEGIFTIESRQHLTLLESWVQEKRVPVKVYLRLTSGNQFGMDEEVVKDMIREREKYPLIQIEGIHFFSGTQKKKLSRLEKELAYLDAFCIALKEEYDFEVKNLEYGPGAAISYFPSDKNVLTLEENLEGMKQLLSNMKFGGHITLEMGRFLAAMCGYYFTSVRDTKTNKGENYCIVDGGIHQMNYDGQLKGMYLPYMKHLQKTEEGYIVSERAQEKQVQEETGQEAAAAEGKSEVEAEVFEKWNICGALCTINDVICRQAPVGIVKMGDVFVWERTGAYSVTEGMSLFLSRDLPEIFFYSREDGFQSVRKPEKTYRLNCPEQEDKIIRKSSK